MSFAFFHTEAILFNLSRDVNFEGGFHSVLASRWHKIRLVHHDFGGKPNDGDMNPLWANKIVATGELDLGDPLGLMKNMNIPFSTQCGLRGMTEPTDQVTKTGNVILFQDASGNDMVEIKNSPQKQQGSSWEIRPWTQKDELPLRETPTTNMTLYAHCLN
jgi:hypothetical protein